MQRTHDRPQRKPGDLSVMTLGLAALGSASATLLVGRFGLAGTVAGAALTPVVITLVRELGRRPVESVTHLRPGAQIPRFARLPSRLRKRWRTIAVTSAAAFALVVAVFTVPDLLAGQSVVADRPSTFFSGAERAPADAETAPDPAPDAPAAPQTPTAPEEEIPVPTEPPPTQPAPEEPAPVPEAPAPAPAPAPSPAPAPPPAG